MYQKCNVDFEYISQSLVNNAEPYLYESNNFKYKRKIPYLSVSSYVTIYVYVYPMHKTFYLLIGIYHTIDLNIRYTSSSISIFSSQYNTVRTLKSSCLGISLVTAAKLIGWIRCGIYKKKQNHSLLFILIKSTNLNRSSVKAPTIKYNTKSWQKCWLCTLFFFEFYLFSCFQISWIVFSSETHSYLTACSYLSVLSYLLIYMD